MIRCRPAEAFAREAPPTESERFQSAAAFCRRPPSKSISKCDMAESAVHGAMPEPADAIHKTWINGFPLGLLLSIGLWALILAPFLAG